MSTLVGRSQIWKYKWNTPQPYEKIARLQDQWARERYQDLIPNRLLRLQHTPVVTLGRRGRTEHLRCTPDELRNRGIDYFKASRGGDVTYHAPGQWVVYPIVELSSLNIRARGYLYSLEEVAIKTCEDFGVQAFRVEGKNGAWTAAGKIAAIGFHIKRGITLHGMSFNVNLDLSGFETIVPCGLLGDPVCSLQSVLHQSTPPLSAVGDALEKNFEEVFNCTLLDTNTSSESTTDDPEY